MLVVGVFLNAALVFAVWHEVSAVAQGGRAGLGAQDFQCYDAEGDGSLGAISIQVTDQETWEA